MKSRISGAPEDGVTSFGHAGAAEQLVREAESLQGGADLHELSWSVRADRPVNLPSVVADAHAHGKAGAVLGGVLSHDGEYFLVVGDRAFSVDQLAGHVALLDGVVAELVYLAKYLRKVGAADGPGLLSEGTASAQRINKTIPLKPCALSGCNYPEGGCSGECMGARP